VSCLFYTSHVLWHLGYPDLALEKSHEALALTRDLSHSFTTVIALDYAAMLHQFRREELAARERAEKAISLCGDQGFAYYLAWGPIIQGWSLAEQGEDGIAQLQRGLETLRATGARLRRPYYLALLAEACVKAGEAEEGMSLLDEALTAMRATGERYYEAELHRLKGSLLLARGEDENQAERSFGRAMEVSRQQGTRSLELRTATSLARLWHKQGKKAQGRQLLEETYRWFSEGFDTPDLREARCALLKELF
jgi:predicted ATPase